MNKSLVKHCLCPGSQGNPAPEKLGCWLKSQQWHPPSNPWETLSSQPGQQRYVGRGHFTVGFSLPWRASQWGCTVCLAGTDWNWPTVIRILRWILTDPHLNPMCVLYLCNRRQIGNHRPGQQTIQAVSTWRNLEYFHNGCSHQTLLKTWSLILIFLPNLLSSSLCFASWSPSRVSGDGLTSPHKQVGWLL